jgi:hypothetical protein
MRDDGRRRHVHADQVGQVQVLLERLVELIEGDTTRHPCRVVAVRLDLPDRGELVLDAVDDLRFGVHAAHRRFRRGIMLTVKRKSHSAGCSG